MPGTTNGGKAAAKTNMSRYGKDFYRELGRKGGLKKGPKGFALMDKDVVREAGRKGGRASRRGKAL